MIVIAHRGRHDHYGENTKDAFKAALQSGASCVETDLRLSKDGEVILFHDAEITVKGRVYPCRELTADELKRAVPDLMLFSEFADILPTDVVLTLDIKTPGVVDAIKDRLSIEPQRFHITSFWHDEVKSAARLLPEVNTSIILSSRPVYIMPLLEAAGTKGLSVRRDYLDAAIVCQLQDEGVSLRAYTVNEYEEAQKLCQWGLEAIYTDNPALYKAFS